jgi:hypothetical protein
MSFEGVVLVLGVAGLVRLLGRVAAGWWEAVAARPRRLLPPGRRIY